MMARRPPPALTTRDSQVLADLHRVRLLTGAQLERLHFSHLASANARGSARRRSLGRLVAADLISTLPRRVGGERAGSAGLIYTLDSRGLRLGQATSGRVRRPWATSERFVDHTLAVAELYVRLRELERASLVRLLSFDAEPASWYKTLDGLILKPDAYAVLEQAGWERHYWLEVDRSTESLPTLRRKLDQYRQAAAASESGPEGVPPLVLVTVPDMARAVQLERIIAAMPDPAAQLFEVRLYGATFLSDHAATTARPPS